MRVEDPAPVHEEPQQSGKDHQGGGHAGGDAGRHDLAQAPDPLMTDEHQAAEPGDGGQTRNEHRFARALGQDGRFLLLGEDL